MTRRVISNPLYGVRDLLNLFLPIWKKQNKANLHKFLILDGRMRINYCFDKINYLHKMFACKCSEKTYRE